MIPVHLKDEEEIIFSQSIGIPLSLKVKIVCILSGLAPADN